MRKTIIFWFRRDLRLHDNAGLFYALQAAQQQGAQLVPVFVFDRTILDALPRRDRRVEFIHEALTNMQSELTALGSTLLVRYGTPEQVWHSLCDEFANADAPVIAAHTNGDYEPYARTRDAAIAALLLARGVALHTHKDHVVTEKSEVLTGEGRPYTVFTPYSKRWKAIVGAAPAEFLQEYASAPRGEQQSQQSSFSALFWRHEPLALPTLASMGFETTNAERNNDAEAPSPAAFATPFPSAVLDESVVRSYDKTRDFPAIAGTTRLSVHLRFGTVSIRELVRRAQTLNETWLNELIWRDFYQQILWHFPHVADRAFKPAYDAIPWRNPATDSAAARDYEAWKQGLTGYPIVDAGMRELNTTGYMHNRVRMVVASFLTKHLLLDWRLGERYFAEKLLDFDLAANNGGWQWAAGTGCDAAPYFRVFNPTSQTEKFDPDFVYIKRWVHELDSMHYPAPIVEHKYARERALATYKQALQ
jgi:deoxyribodipyrimidine photo-lyase